MDRIARSQRQQAGQELRSQRYERDEYHGTREEARELRYQAAKSAAVCGECFRPLAPTDSVTMEYRKVSGSRRAGNERWLRVPICLLCTLDDIELVRWRNCWPFYREPRWHRTRCRNCERLIRIYRHAARVCCDDCARLARNQRNKLRRRVKHTPMMCIICGEIFFPRRADAVTCSNRCRQALHRAERAAERADVDYPLRSRKSDNAKAQRKGR